MKKTQKNLLLCLLLSICLMASSTVVCFAAESNGSESIVPYGMTDIRDISGAYHYNQQFSFTITDSSRLVKIMYVAGYTDGNTMKANLEIKNSSGITVWSANNVTGKEQILSVKKLPTGSYTLYFRPDRFVDQYAIAGKIYYMD